MKNQKNKNQKTKVEYSKIICVVNIENKYHIERILIASGCKNRFRKFSYVDQRRVFGFPLFGKKAVMFDSKSKKVKIISHFSSAHRGTIYSFTLDQVFDRFQKQHEIR